jgi:hypothetical protein
MTELVEGRDYQIEDAGLGRFSDYLQQTGRNAISRAIQYANHFTSGQRGRYATMAINLAGITNDREEFQAVFDRNPEVLNEYFEHVDVEKLARLLDVDEAIARSVPRAIKRSAVPVAVGAIIGVVGLTIYNRKKGK